MRPETPKVKHPFTVNPEFMAAVAELHEVLRAGMIELSKACTEISVALRKFELDNKPPAD